MSALFWIVGSYAAAAIIVIPFRHHIDRAMQPSSLRRRQLAALVERDETRPW